MRKRRNLSRWYNRTGKGGWLVRIRRSPRIHQKLFTDLRYGGCRKAELAAREWRDNMLQKLPPPRARNPRVRPNRNSKSGVCGVMRMRRGSGWYYAASWKPIGRRKRERVWSIKKYGEEGARQQAIEWRHRMVSEVTKAKKAARNSAAKGG